MKELRTPHIIHIFALAHAIIVLICHAMSVSDELVLTVATIGMISIVALRKRQGVGIMAASLIAGNIAGYLIGTYGARLLDNLLQNTTLVHALMSFITTEIIGLTLLLLYNFIDSLRHRDSSSHKGIGGLRTKNTLLIIGALLLARIAYSKFLGNMLTEESITVSLRLLSTNSLAILTLICCNIIYSLIIHRYKCFTNPLIYAIGLICETAFVALSTSLIIGYNLPFTTDIPFAEASMLQHFAIITLVNLIVFVSIVLLDHLQRTHNRMRREREKRYLAQFQYNILKQQVNPHFLFNSLNILNGLIEEQKNEEASEYVRQLASLYRYMLHSEEEQVIRLQEELDFIEKYLDLLRVRFPNGFTVDYQIDEKLLNRCVVPCSIQMLIENAFKHNIAHSDQPLHITIGTTGDSDSIWVKNNLQPKFSNSSDNQVGLKNISKQYHTVAGRDIVIRQSKNEYYIELPLI